MPATAKDEPIDPLKMDIDDEEEIEYNIDAMNQDLEVIIILSVLPHLSDHVCFIGRRPRNGRPG